MPSTENYVVFAYFITYDGTIMDNRTLNLREQLVLLARAYGAAKRLSLSTISTTVLSNGLILSRMAEGEADVTTARLEGAMKWFSDNWPENTEWPKGIARPEKEAA